MQRKARDCQEQVLKLPETKKRISGLEGCRNRLRIHPFCSYCFIVECWLETVTKRARLGKSWFAIEKGRNSRKNTVVKNEVCISCAIRDLERLMSGVMQSEFCGLSLIHANPPSNLLLEMMCLKEGQHDIG